MNLQKPRILLSTPSLTFLFTFVIIKVEFLQWISSEFKNPTKCSVTFIFPTSKNIEEIVFEQLIPLISAHKQ